MKELLASIVGAVIGAVVAWLLGAGDRKRAKEASTLQKRNLQLEEENAKLSAVDRFYPRESFSLENESGFQQYLELSAPIEFSVVLIEYLSGDDVCHASEQLLLTGQTVKLALNNEHLRTINHKYFNGFDGTSIVKFRITVKVGSYEKRIVVNQKIKGITLMKFAK